MKWEMQSVPIFESGLDIQYMHLYPIDIEEQQLYHVRSS